MTIGIHGNHEQSTADALAGSVSRPPTCRDVLQLPRTTSILSIDLGQPALLRDRRVETGTSPSEIPEARHEQTGDYIFLYVGIPAATLYAALRPLCKAAHRHGL